VAPDEGGGTGARRAALLAELRQRFGATPDRREVEIVLAARGFGAEVVAEVVGALLGEPVEAAGTAGGTRTEGAESAVAPAGSAVTSAGSRGAVVLDSGRAPLEPDDALAVPALRVPAPYERARFAPDAWGYLLQVQATAGWSAAELEQVIERALMHIEGRIALADLRPLVEGAIAEEGGAAPSKTVH
jgi:Smg protein